MSFTALLAHRCTIKRLTPMDREGAASWDWQSIEAGVRCRVDLSFTRLGKDPTWTPEAGRPSDRTGVAFFMPTVDIRPGDRIQVTRGITGQFEVQGALDHVPGHNGGVHHIEASVSEVAQPLGQE